MSESTAFYVGVDLGQSIDPSAVAVVEKHTEKKSLGYQVPPSKPWSVRERFDVRTTYQCRWIERLPLGMKYPQQRALLREMLARPQFRSQSVEVALDYGGVGRAVFDDFVAETLPCRQLFGVALTGGRETTRKGNTVSLPKRELIATTQVLLQNGDLVIAKDIPESGALVQELLTYQIRVDPATGFDHYDAKSGAHDDMVIALCLACWIGENPGPRVFIGGR